MVTYIRVVLVDVLVAHQRHGSRTCLCGWDFLGMSHPEHVADAYEQAISRAERRDFDAPEGPWSDHDDAG